MAKTDAEIKQQVTHELEADTRVEATDVGVEVRGGIVRLTGTVNSWGKRIAAQQAAHRVAGVRDVANDVEVKLPRSGIPDDADIAKAVRHALEWDAFVPDDRIRSTVSRGWVTLEGSVDYYIQRGDAERAVRNLKGVRGITNSLFVDPSNLTADDLRRSLEQALARQAQHHMNKITLGIEDGVVKLSGPVQSWAEKKALIGAVNGLRGVRGIEDDLTIAHSAV